MNWFKRIFCSQDDFNGHVDQWGLPSVENIAPMPKVKPPKADKDISEPVLAMLNAWKDSPKMFKLNLDKEVYHLWNESRSYGNPTAQLKVFDTQRKEAFYFSVSLGSESYSDGYQSVFYMFGFAQHKIYPVLGSNVTSKPSWMTQDELDLIIKTVKPYYLKRVERYRDIVESRMDRSRKASEMKSEIAKQKERDRLTGIYK